MTREIETADKMFERQRVERQAFLSDLVRRLDEEGYNWELPEDFVRRKYYDGRGLLLHNASDWRDYSIVLSPDELEGQKGKIILISFEGDTRELHLSEGEVFTHGWIAAAERETNKAIAELQNTQIPA